MLIKTNGIITTKAMYNEDIPPASGTEEGWRKGVLDVVATVGEEDDVVIASVMSRVSPLATPSTARLAPSSRVFPRKPNCC